MGEIFFYICARVKRITQAHIFHIVIDIFKSIKFRNLQDN